MVSLAQLTIARNVRTATGLNKQSIAELAESIKEHGLLQPILIAKAGDGFAVIAGQRRTLACIEAGLKEIPAIEVDGNNGADLKAKQIVENLQRENLSLAETCAAVREMLAMLGKPSDVAAKLKKSKSWVSKHLALTGPTFTQEVRDLMTDGHCQDLDTLHILNQIAKHPEGGAACALLVQTAKVDGLSRGAAQKALDELRSEQQADEEEDGEEPAEGAEEQEKFGKLELAEGPAKLLLAALRFAQQKKPSSRPGEALIGHVEAFIQKNWPKTVELREEQSDVPV